MFLQAVADLAVALCLVFVGDTMVCLRVEMCRFLNDCGTVEKRFFHRGEFYSLLTVFVVNLRDLWAQAWGRPLPEGEGSEPDLPRAGALHVDELDCIAFEIGSLETRFRDRPRDESVVECQDYTNIVESFSRDFKAGKRD